MLQFSLISLIPGLIRNLHDCADPAFNSYEESLVMPTSLRTSERASLLSYMGLPLQIFGKGSLFGPYTPLQQLDLLADYGTKSYVVGSTNSLLLQQKDRYSDILINVSGFQLESRSAFYLFSLSRCNHFQRCLFRARSRTNSQSALMDVHSKHVLCYGVTAGL